MSAAPPAASRRELLLHDLGPPSSALHDEVLQGLTGRPKSLPSKLLYDEVGSRLYDRICGLDAYYPSRTELAILRRHIREIAAVLGPGVRLVEPGSGSGAKTRLLLRHLIEPAGYIPVDIAKSQLIDFAASVSAAYPSLDVQPVCADYTTGLELPPTDRAHARTVVFFPGSSIGNFEPHEAAAFLARCADLVGPEGGVLIGVDLKKERSRLELAYNDPEGVTAAFNLNVLVRLNREFGTDFDPGAFQHHAPYDEAHGRIEMRLVSRRAQHVHVRGPGGRGRFTLSFDEGEAIVTERSYKYEIPEFEAIAERAGLGLGRVWTDPGRAFAVLWLVPRTASQR